MSGNMLQGLLLHICLESFVLQWRPTSVGPDIQPSSDQPPSPELFCSSALALALALVTSVGRIMKVEIAHPRIIHAVQQRLEAACCAFSGLH